MVSLPINLDSLRFSSSFSSLKRPLLLRCTPLICYMCPLLLGLGENLFCFLCWSPQSTAPGRAALRPQPRPGKKLVGGTAMPTSPQASRHPRLEGLFDHANLLRGRPAPTTLN